MRTKAKLMSVYNDESRMFCNNHVDSEKMPSWLGSKSTEIKIS